MFNKYTLLVNKNNKVPDNIEVLVNLIEIIDIDNEITLVEEETYNAYLSLKQFIKEKFNITIGIDGAYRSVKRQKELYNEFILKYGKSYADSIVAPAGCSEHHTGLAIDLAIYFDNEGYISTNDNFDRVDKIFKKFIHPYLHEFGFILRYLDSKQDITGYPYEPWHIRYIGKDIATAVYKDNITLEEYINNNL